MERKMSDTPFKQYKKETFYQGPKKQELPSCFKLPYLRFKKTKEKNVQFERFLDVLKELQIWIPFAKVLEKLSIYAKFMKELLTHKTNL